MQVSNKKLTGSTQENIFKQFETLLADLRSPQETKLWLENFMTETERQVFAKRLAVAQMLWQKKSYQEIKDSLKVSSATISSVSDQLNTPGMKLAQKKLELERWAEGIVKLFSF